MITCFSRAYRASWQSVPDLVPMRKLFSLLYPFSINGKLEFQTNLSLHWTAQTSRGSGVRVLRDHVYIGSKLMKQTSCPRISVICVSLNRAAIWSFTIIVHVWSYPWNSWLITNYLFVELDSPYYALRGLELLKCVFPELPQASGCLIWAIVDRQSV